ncbi:hypothetical protein S40293_01193 [Stachybotrys chartarum IBT 40293]|nr:hypothetical protein S40293_01193 [Stachybotrys chartarum IBT 40293]
MLSIIRCLLGIPPNATSSLIEQYDVYPLHLLDNLSDVCRNVAPSIGQAAQHWRLAQMAGRFRRNAIGVLEVHVPHEFSLQVPAVRYKHTNFDMDPNEHPLGKLLPHVTTYPSLQHSCGHFRDFCSSTDAPGHMADYFTSDEPPIALRVTSFRDSTLVAVSWSHTIADAMAFRDLVSTWCQVLAGNEDLVPQVLGAWQDAAASIWEAQAPNPEPYIWKSKMLTGLQFFRFALRFVWLLCTQRSVGARTLFITASFVANLRDRASAEVPDASFISDGDVLSVWLSRLIVSVNEWTGPVTLLNVVDIRSRLPSVFEKPGVYLQNLTMPSFVFLESSVIKNSALGLLASHVCNSIVSQTTEAQTRAIYSLAIPHVKQGNRAPVFGDANSSLVPISNWAKAKFIETVDFSPAVLRAGSSSMTRTNPPGRMVYQITSQVKQSTLNRNTAVIIAKDDAGNYWINL